MRVLLTLIFLVLSLGLADWLFANWFLWQMADFDCADGYWACRRSIILPTALQCGLPFVAWVGLLVPLRREWKKR